MQLGRLIILSLRPSPDFALAGAVLLEGRSEKREEAGSPASWRTCLDISTHEMSRLRVRKRLRSRYWTGLSRPACPARAAAPFPLLGNRGLRRDRWALAEACPSTLDRRLGRARKHPSRATRPAPREAQASRPETPGRMSRPAAQKLGRRLTLDAPRAWSARRQAVSFPERGPVEHRRTGPEQGKRTKAPAARRRLSARGSRDSDHRAE